MCIRDSSWTENEIENVQASEASISDADIAEEVTAFTRAQILSQAATAMLAQAMGADAWLGVVVLLAMWGNIAMAGFAGSFIPTFLDRIGQDPAVASTVFLTALTDLTGFLLLLGLATVIL